MEEQAENATAEVATESGKKKEVVITNCPVQTVVVYADRAEVRAY